MITLDLKRQLQSFYKPSTRTPEIVAVPALPYLMIDGSGDPNTAPAYREAVAALYSAAYALKFALKRRGIVYPIMPLEGLWWIDDMAAFLTTPKSAWQWTMLIVQPEVVTEADLAQTVAEVRRKKPLAALERLRLETLTEGSAAQIMHVGPYAAEAPTIARLHQFIATAGARLRGKHHEIYLSDPQRGTPEKLRTIIRQPLQRAS